MKINSIGTFALLQEPKMTKFILTFLNEDGEPYTEEHSFESTETVTAREWADDYCYAKTDKGYYKIREVKNDSKRTE